MQWLQQLGVLFRENQHLQALVTVLAAILVARIADLVISRLLRRIAERTASDVDDQIVDLAHKPIFYTILLAGISLALRLDPLPSPFDTVASGALTTLIILLLLLFGIRLASLLLAWAAEHPERFHVVQPATRPLFEIASKVLLFGAAAYFVLLAWKLDPTGWAASAGIIGIAVGFAAKDTLANLFAGVFILADTPYKVGDFIQLDQERGQVTWIGLRSTRILTRDDMEITIPNSTIANSKIINESGGPHVKYRLRIPVGVAYGSDVDQVREVLNSVAGENDRICADPEPRVRFRGFGDSSLDFELLCWIPDPRLRGQLQDALNTSVYKALAAAGIEIPFPQRDVHIKQAPDKTA